MKITHWNQELSDLTLEQRAKYEFNRDYATVISDVTSYDHGFLRKLLDSHWQTAIQTGALGPARVSEQEAWKLLEEHHHMREEKVMHADPEPKRIYLWPRGGVPKITEYAENPGYEYADMPDFEPYMLEMLVPEEQKVKGALVLCAGGGHRYRSNVEETYEVALEFNKLGYQCLIVNYRVLPYTDEESALDVARAVRYVRYQKDKYRVPADRIAVAGFSYGGMAVSRAADMFYGAKSAEVLLEDYRRDELDTVPADINVNLCIYSCVPEELHNVNYPPTFLCWGLADDLIGGMAERSFHTLRKQGVKTEIHTFAGVPHAFGAGRDAGNRFFATAAMWIPCADVFMQDLYKQNESEKR